jgi:hypothetical protein
MEDNETEMVMEKNESNQHHDSEIEEEEEEEDEHDFVKSLEPQKVEKSLENKNKKIVEINEIKQLVTENLKDEILNFKKNFKENLKKQVNQMN